MADYQNAVQTLRRLALQQQGMVDAADILEQIGSPTQALEELNTQLAAARAALSDIQAEQKQAAANLGQARANADSIVHQAHAEAGHVTQQADDTAASLLDDARDQAGRIMREANAQAASAVSRAMQDAAMQISKLKQDIDEAAAQAAAAIAARDTAQAQLDIINALLAEAKAKIAALSNI